MPSNVPSYMVEVYRTARSLPKDVWEALHANPRGSNVILPYAKQARQSPEHPNVWLVCSTSRPGSCTPSVDFILSCTGGPLGSYPLFIYTPIPTIQLAPSYYVPRMHSLIRKLQQSVPPERVFSVFALDPLSRCFASIWAQVSGIKLHQDPEYYAAKLTYCNVDTLQTGHLSPLRDVTYDLRLARESDVKNVAELCHGFATTSEPFTLTTTEAMTEASLLIKKGQVWVHEICAPRQRPEIASIVAVTRTSDTVAGITKVYTNPRWRQRGCAERLVRHVCQELLRTKESIILYVAHNNPTAAKVYHRVGFVGLSEDEEPVEGVDSWLELGFDQKKVELGHW
ncbi:hypothetical protein FOMPIDRAFT_1141500 [Fomitopsis schrenkii]|uniref:N-acetyltransferase domain-containing protein n=1 Tax=Fomitopsis schrenkii TaxID=2126942 RepID=S8FS26_FOMSC|nr:hypothetical protein FOMPIDRAFT_1141500 [Fomitopsis schrenkii]